MSSPTNYITYLDSITNKSRVGHLDFSTSTIQPLSFASGTFIPNLYQVIEAGSENITKTNEEPFKVAEVSILPPLPARDVLCVGKNYMEHAREFNQSGFDSSDKVDRPSAPVIFTKRFTSIIAHGEDIYSHPDFTQTADYEGEIGVIIGKPCYRIAEPDAIDYVWGYTIVNDMTARERQRDHKQFYLGKSPDTFCPMGPIAVPKEHVDKVLRVQTHVNGELRQNATTEDLIFSIPFLLKTMSEGQTLMPGDVLATGTPAGVGIGRTPPTYLSPGDTISISVNGLGTLTNRITSAKSTNDNTIRPFCSHHSQLASPNNLYNLRIINNKAMHYTHSGCANGPPIIFVHGLGLSSEYFTPMISALNLSHTHSIYTYDLEGHGLTPTTPLSRITISSFAQDLSALIQQIQLERSVDMQELTIIAQGLGCLIALHYFSSRSLQPGLQHASPCKLLLMHPPPVPLSSEHSLALNKTALQIRQGSLQPDQAPPFTTLDKAPISHTPIALVALRSILRSTHPEAFAKTCIALAQAPAIQVGGGGLAAAAVASNDVSVLLVTGSDDRFSTPDCCKKLVVHGFRGNARLEILHGVGEWSGFEDVQGLKGAVEGWIGGGRVGVV